MKIKKAYYLKSCTNHKQFPQYTYPEFAFLGRSNVGKSSLINMVLNQKNLVKTGAKPGVTKTINFFVVNDNTSFVDLPGFGYAKVPLELKKAFLPMVKNYITNRPNLKLAFLLIDIRRIPDNDEQSILEILIANKVPVAITLTKCDKLSNNQLHKNIQAICEKLELPNDSVFISSSQSGKGKKELVQLIDEYNQPL